MTDTYGPDFYAAQAPGSNSAARALAPMIKDIFAPTSLLDVGCGAGTWTSAFLELGVDAYGIDGPWVSEAVRRIPADRFIQYDFAAQPAAIAPSLPKARFDVTICLEVLEHIDPAKARAMVAFLTSTSDIVLAGGAIPGQGGLHHVNEQWPAYWVDLFAAHDYRALDCIRPIFGAVSGIEYYYAQNTILYYKGELPARLEDELRKAVFLALQSPRPLVYQDLYQFYRGKVERRKRSFWRL